MASVNRWYFDKTNKQKKEASGQPQTPSLQRKLGNIATPTMYMYWRVIQSTHIKGFL